MKKKSLNVGVFNPKLIYTASPYCGDEIFAKGLEANDYEVTRFDYRAEFRPNESLLEIAKQNDYDLFWFGKCEKIDPETIGILKSKNKDAIFCKWAADMRDEPTWHDLGHNQYIDWFFGTFGGEYLQKHLNSNMKGACSIVAFTDSDFYKPLNNAEKEYTSDVLWTGRRGFGDNEMRNQIIDSLLTEFRDINVNVIGISNDWLGDPEYQQAITGTKIGIGSNSFNRHLYSSDRLGNYMASGTFYLTQYIEGIEKVFKKGVHLDWFTSIDEMKSLIKYYLKYEDKRKEIAQKGREFILQHFDYNPLVKNCLHVINTGNSFNKWDSIFKNHD